MDQTTRAIVINKFGTLMLANAELATENLELMKSGREKDATISDLRAQIADLQKQASDNNPVDGSAGGSTTFAAHELKIVGGAAGTFTGGSGAGITSGTGGGGGSGGGNAEPN